MQLKSTHTTITVVTVAVDGRLDAQAAPELRALLAEQFERGVVDITVDLADVEFVDSAGLAALVRGMKQAREKGGDLRLVRPRSDDAFRVFELTKFDQVFSIADPS
ncbi:MAG: STAS domain-containing protein [Actinomycetota bacterium]